MRDNGHRYGQWLFALSVGVLVVIGSYRWITNSEPRVERDRQVRAIRQSRILLETALALKDLQVVDPSAPNRVVGKTYIYPSPSGWEITGYYRRDAYDLWHPYLISIGTDGRLTRLKLADSQILNSGLADNDARIEVLP